ERGARPGTKGARRVTISEAFAFTLALEASPFDLFLPDEGEDLRIGDTTLDYQRAVLWLSGALGMQRLMAQAELLQQQAESRRALVDAFLRELQPKEGS